MSWTFLLSWWCQPTLAAPPPELPRLYEGPDVTQVDLLRVSENGPRIYVEAVLPDGGRGLFLVDTGADISILSRSTAERLGLRIDEDFGAIAGMSGVVSMDRAILPKIELGDAVVPGIEVGVGIPGLSDRAGAMPLDGLLGNNVWSRFTLEIDYPADLMVLHAPGTFRTKRRAGPMYFNGSHVFAPLELRTSDDPKTTHKVTLRVDTGASELSICGNTAMAFSQSFSEGLEPVYGIGASATLPPFRNLRSTRRIPLAGVLVGGRKLKNIETARWLDYDGQQVCPGDLKGLVGHELLSGHRVIFDYAGGRLHLDKSRRRPRQNNGHALHLARDVETHGVDAPSRGLMRARLKVRLDDFDGAIVDLMSFLGTSPMPAEERTARVLLANLWRNAGDLTKASEALAPLAPPDLVDEGEIIAVINGLLFEDRVDEALEIARDATRARPDSGWSWVALADALLASGKSSEAHEAMIRAVELERYPDAHLLRRARIALASGDRHASQAHVRKLLSLYPMGGEVLWFYATLADDSASRSTFAHDLAAAMDRLHPRMRPMDFLVAATEVLGEHDEALAYMNEGIERDCAALEGAGADNCLAWYWSLAGVRTDEALARIDRALEAGERSDYLDTKAMVHLARGEYDAASGAARAAARLSPDNIYMLWQAERIAQIAEEAR